MYFHNYEISFYLSENEGPGLGRVREVTGHPESEKMASGSSEREKYFRRKEKETS
jgi:hypothetical protein